MITNQQTINQLGKSLQLWYSLRQALNMRWELVANDGDAHQQTGVASCCWGPLWGCCSRKGLETTLDSWILAENLLFTRSKGHGSGCTTAYSGMHRYLYRVYSLSVQWQHTKPAQLNGGTDTKTVPASKTKGKYAGNTPNTLILANRPRSWKPVCCAVACAPLYAVSLLTVCQSHKQDTKKFEMR